MTLALVSDGLAPTKQQVASSDINICDRNSIFVGPDGSSPARPGPKPGLDKILEIWEPGFQKFGIRKKSQKWKFSKSKYPCRPRCRQGLDSPEKELPGPIWGHSRPCFHGPKNIKCQKFVYFPWWANGPYSPGLGSCAGVMFSNWSISDDAAA